MLFRPASGRSARARPSRSGGLLADQAGRGPPVPAGCRPVSLASALLFRPAAGRRCVCMTYRPNNRRCRHAELLKLTGAAAMLANITLTLPAEPSNGPPETRSTGTHMSRCPRIRKSCRGNYRRGLPCCPGVCPRCFAVRSGFLRGERTGSRWAQMATGSCLLEGDMEQKTTVADRSTGVRGHEGVSLSGGKRWQLLRPAHFQSLDQSEHSGVDGGEVRGCVWFSVGSAWQAGRRRALTGRVCRAPSGRTAADGDRPSPR
eukprot:superscaffoldBa00006262_g21324